MRGGARCTQVLVQLRVERRNSGLNIFNLDAYFWRRGSTVEGCPELERLQPSLVKLA